jgi:hypothetical protein
MIRRFVFAILFSAIASGASAQTPKPATPAPTPTAQPEAKVDVNRAAFEAVRKVRGRDLNVQVEITISDQTGSSPPAKKVVTLLAADQTQGRVRANARASRRDVGFVGTGLNVDARPTVLDNERILLELTLQYQPMHESSTAQEPTNLDESISVILQNGKPLTISQAADPISDRKMTVEVKATVIR